MARTFTPRVNRHVQYFDLVLKKWKSAQIVGVQSSTVVDLKLSDGRTVIGSVKAPVTGAPTVTLPSSTGNLLTAVDSDFETGIGSWVNVSNSALSAITGSVYHGSQVMLATAQGAVPAIMQAQSGEYAVSPSTQYTASAWFLSQSAHTAACVINWYTAAHAFISQAAPTSNAVTSIAQYAQAWTTATSPANAAFARVFLQWGGVDTFAISEQGYVDGVMLIGGTSTTWELGGTGGSAGGTSGGWKVF